MPKVSVILPVYNSAEYLPGCLDCLQNQTLQELEIICINDGSTDDSFSVLQERAKNDSRIVILNQDNQGAGPARNAGIRAAKGEYIAFLDSDDYYPDADTLQVMYSTAKEHNAEICGGSFSIERGYGLQR